MGPPRHRRSTRLARTARRRHPSPNRTIARTGGVAPGVSAPASEDLLGRWTSCATCESSSSSSVARSAALRHLEYAARLLDDESAHSHEGEVTALYNLDAVETVMLIKQGKDKGLSPAAIEAAHRFKAAKTPRVPAAQLTN